MLHDMTWPTCRTRERSRNTALWTGTNRDACSNDCASAAVRMSTCGDFENVDSPEGLRQERNLQVSEEANIFDNENIPLSLRQFQRPDQPKLPDGRSNSLSVTDEDHPDINSVANVFERARVKCATNVSTPDDGDVSSRCRIPWCGGVRGVLANLQKRAAVCSMIVCPGLTKTWNGETPNRRWWQAWCLCCKRSTEASAYGREEKGAPRSIAPVSRWHAHDTSLWSVVVSFVPEASVWGRAARRSGDISNKVSMRIDNVPPTSQGLLRSQMETSDTHGNLFYSKGDRFHMCFTKWHALKLVKNDRVLMLDIDLGTEEYHPAENNYSY